MAALRLLLLLPTLVRAAHQIVSIGDACDKYQWTVCASDADCTGSICDERKSDGTRADHCQYGTYNCVVPSIPGCTQTRCVPVPESAFICSTDEDCETTTGHGDVCVQGDCIACGATSGFSAGGCEFNQTDRAWNDPNAWGPGPAQSKCEYSQHLLPGYDCPTGGRAPSGQEQFYPTGAVSAAFLGLAAGCSNASVHPNDGGSGSGVCVDGNGPSGFKCNVAPNSGVSQGGTAAQFPLTNCEPSAYQPCGWDCRDGSAKGVQCAYDQMCFMVTRYAHRPANPALATATGPPTPLLLPP
jgi:hypothetical protein